MPLNEIFCCYLTYFLVSSAEQREIVGVIAEFPQYDRYFQFSCFLRQDSRPVADNCIDFILSCTGYDVHCLVLRFSQCRIDRNEFPASALIGILDHAPEKTSFRFTVIVAEQ